MPPKKITWGDVPNSDFVKDKDNVNGRWIECRLCNVRIKVRATFGFTEWEHHCASTKHCDKLKHHLKTGSMNKLTSYFHTSSGTKNKNMGLAIESPSVSSPPQKKTKFTIPCPGFSYGKNPELLHLYSKYKKRIV